MAPRLLFLLKYFLFWLAFFVVGKLVFLAWFYPQTAALPIGTTLGTIVYGLRMDATATAFVSTVPFLLILVSTVAPWRWIRPLIFWWTAPLILFIAGLTAGDLELYRELGYRIDATWLQYLNTPKEMGASIASQPLWALFLIIGILTALGIWAFRKWVLPAPDAMPQRSLLAILPVAFLTALLVIPARGGTQLAPITQSTVYFSTSDFANKAAVNVAWSFFNGLYYHDADKKNPYVVMSAAEALAVRDSLVGGVDTLPPTLRLLRTRRPNIILIVWEGFTAKAIGALNGVTDAVPEIDSLSRTGVLFDRFYA